MASVPDYPCPPLTLYHNPACSKSRKAHELLTAKLGEGQFRVVPYLDRPLTRPELETLAVKLSAPDGVKALVREADAKKLGIDVATATAGELLTALATHPQLLQRPVAEAAIAAVVGRPPEQVLTLI